MCDLSTVKLRSEKRLSPWAVLLFDLGAMLLALGLAFQLRFNFYVPQLEINLALPFIPVYLIIGAITMIIMGSHRGMLRYSSVDDVRRVFIAMVVVTILLLVGNTVRFYLFDEKYILPRSVVIIAGMGSLLIILGVRIAAKLLYQRLALQSGKAESVVIYGTGEAGLLTKRALEREGLSNLKVVGFIDDDERAAGKRMEGVTVYKPKGYTQLITKREIDKLVIAAPKTDLNNRTLVVDRSLDNNIDVLQVPPVTEWINGQLSGDQLRNLKIEDLLGRPEIHLDGSELKDTLANGVTLVTGAAGSIGQEISRQLATLGVEKLILVDFAESALYDLEMEFKQKGLDTSAVFLVCDVRDKNSMSRLFETHLPQNVYHAAAYKHVPLMEATPCEAIKTNVHGTQVVAELAAKFGSQRFVLISTDKAVNPTSVMGASKRAAEMVVKMISQDSTTRFVTTRFGNVLGSNGSVIPLFRKQLEVGGPLTVTHPEVTRFFMTIPEACRLVLEAASMGKGGEIYLFDMGLSVKIKDLAERMIRLSGKEPGVDIKIDYVGLRPGEKLYEELLADEENSLPTHHPRILIGKVKEQDSQGVTESINKLKAAAESGTDAEVIELLHELIPEYQEEETERNFERSTN